MAKRKRRKRGLGLTPAGHIKAAAALEVEALRRFRESREHADRGACRTALDRLHDGQYLFSQMSVHEHSQGDSLNKSMERLSTVAQRARETQNLYARRCQSNSANKGLSGRRRSL